MEMQYVPFKAAGKAAAAKEPGAQKENMTLGMSKRKLTSGHKGVLTVTLIRCIDLEVSRLLSAISNRPQHLAKALCTRFGSNMANVIGNLFQSRSL